MSKVVALFVTCLVDNMRPKIGFDTIKLLEDAGFEVEVPEAQVCCGQPNYNGGDQAGASATAKFIIDIFLPFSAVIVPSGSCAGMIRHHYPKLLADDAAYAEKANQLSNKTYEISQFLTAEGYEPKSLVNRHITYHDACAGLRELDIRSEPRQLLEKAGVSISELKESDACCGFGGTFCVKYPDISTAMIDRKIEDIAAAEAGLVTTGDLGCLLNIEGRLSRLGKSIEIKHLVEVLADGLAAEIESPE